jgi:ubiquinone/menaquinone biosynthesis C-methylase UbiE/uncharacterized protein YbaR (Trm112 family)
MNTSLVKLLSCPSCGGESLELVALGRRGDEIETGALRCACGRVYAIQEGIARMLPEALYDASPPPPALLKDEGGGACPERSEGMKDEDGQIHPSSFILHPSDGEAVAHKRSEMRARDEQVGEYDRMWHLNLFGRIEIPVTLHQLSLKPQHVLLEAGCGTGRMTREFASRCFHLIGADFSWESLRVSTQKLRQAGVRNVDLIQADICRLPLRACAFDRVVSCQVLEHVPTPESREKAVEEMARVLRPGGNLVLSAYRYSLLMRLFGQKEGRHAGRIYFYRFCRRELRALLSRVLTVEAITGALVYHYTARCRKTG